MTSSSQPTVVAGRVFFGGDNGFVYSLDAATGCVYWSFENGAIIRGSCHRGTHYRPGDVPLCRVLGDGHANVFAVDAQNGKNALEDKSRFSRGGADYSRNETLQRKIDRSRVVVGGICRRKYRLSVLHIRGSVVALDAGTGQAGLEVLDR